jgi:hypothetical protein
MMVHNRRKRAEFFTEQKALKASAIQTARLAIDNGVATEDQLAFIRREEEHDAQVAAAAAAKAAKRGIFERSKDWLFSGLKKEEGSDSLSQGEKDLGYEQVDQADHSMSGRGSRVVQAIEEKERQISEMTKNAFEAEKQRQRAGGPLDHLGPDSSRDIDDEKPKSGGWTSFMVRR